MLQIVIVVSIVIVNIVGMGVMVVVSRQPEPLPIIVQVLTSMGAVTAGLFAYLKSLENEHQLSQKKDKDE